MQPVAFESHLARQCIPEDAGMTGFAPSFARLSYAVFPTAARARLFAALVVGKW